MIKVWCKSCSGHGVHYEADYDYEENHCGDIEYKCDECDGKGYVEITANANDTYCAEIERKISSEYWLELEYSPESSRCVVWANNYDNTMLFSDNCGTKLELFEKLEKWYNVSIVTGKQIGRAHV